MGDRYDLENALLEVERRAREAVASAAGDIERGLVSGVASALAKLDALRERIRQDERSTT